MFSTLDFLWLFAAKVINYQSTKVSCYWVFPWVTDKKSSWTLIYFQTHKSIHTWIEWLNQKIIKYVGLKFDRVLIKGSAYWLEADGPFGFKGGGCGRVYGERILITVVSFVFWNLCGDAKKVTQIQNLNLFN
jgi:hypothetical protein